LGLPGNFGVSKVSPPYLVMRRSAVTATLSVRELQVWNWTPGSVVRRTIFRPDAGSVGVPATDSTSPVASNPASTGVQNPASPCS